MTTTPAAQLKQAADKLRTLLADPDLTPGPWLSLDGGDRVIHDGPSIEFGRPDYVIDEPVGNAANAELIAAMGPLVALSLADWLESAADMAAAYPEMVHDHDRPACEDYACDVMGQAIATARALLGGVSR